jgi:hypothetical protein
VLDYSLFYLLSGASAPVVLVGDPILFNFDGPTTHRIIRNGGTSPSEFVLPDIGFYEVFWQANIASAAQLELQLNGSQVADTVIGRATADNQLVGDVLIQTTLINEILTINNPGLSQIIITGNAGGSQPVSAVLLIMRIA